MQSNVRVQIEEAESPASLAARPPELSLMSAVLQHAIRSFCECSSSRGVRSRRLFDETSEWFASSDHEWPFAFESICAALAIDPDWIRRLLRQWVDRPGPKQGLSVRLPRLRMESHRRPVGGLATGPTPRRLRAV